VIFSPPHGSPQRRAALYRSLATLFDGGLPVDEAFRRLAPLLPATITVPGRTAGQRLRQAFGERPDAAAELAAVEAAEQIGALARTLRQIADDLDLRCATHRVGRLAMAYPLLVLHLVAPAANFGSLVTAPARFLGVVLTATAVIWALLLGGAWLFRLLERSPRGARWLAVVPMVGAPLVLSARARWLRLVATLHGAGTKAIEMFGIAADALGPAAPSAEYAAVAARARAGATLDEALAELTGPSPEELAPLRSAATVGEFEHAARHLAEVTTTRWRDASRRLALFCGGLIYAIAVLAVMWTVVRFYTGYFGALLGKR
jgi:type II secretory pathway component PulF